MKLYFEFLSIHIKKAMQYKASFLLSALAQLFIPLTCFWGVQFMFMRFKQVDGFTYTEVSLCYAIVLLSFSLAELFFRGFDTFNRMIGDGEFDRVLVRPRNEVFLVLCSRMDLERFGKGIMAIFLLIWALQNCPIDWCAARVMTLIFMILGGIVLFAGVYLIDQAESARVLDAVEALLRRVPAFLLDCTISEEAVDCLYEALYPATVAETVRLRACL